MFDAAKLLLQTAKTCQFERKNTKKVQKNALFSKKVHFFCLVDALWAMGRADGAIGYGLLAIDLLTVHLVGFLGFFAENLN